MKRVFLGLLLLASFGAPSEVRAQSTDQGAAAALYDRAQDQMELGNYAKACRMLEEATRLAPEALGAKLVLGRCYEGEGRLASAWVQYTVVEGLASRSGQHDPERAAKATAAAAAIKDKLAQLVVEVPEAMRAIAGLTVLRDGVEVGPAQWGTPVPVDKGKHVIEVKAPGHQPSRREVVVEADGVSVTVTLEAPAKVVEKPPAPVQAAPELLPPKLVQARPWQRTAGVAVTSAGALSIGVGAILGGIAIARYGASKQGNHCDVRNVCDGEGLSLRNEALGYGNASTVMFGVGTAAVVVGVVMLATVPAPVLEYRTARGSVEVRVLPGGAGVSGRF